MGLAEGSRTAVLLADGVLDPSGPVAEAIEDLWWLMLVLGVLVFILFMVLLVRAFIRGAPEASDQEERHRRLVTRWILLGGIVMPTVIIVGVFAATLFTMREMPHEAPDGALEVEVTAHQFWYEVRYPDSGLVTANEMHVPTGTPIAIRLRSSDVIHSFWVPELGGKEDMLPERVNTLVLQADRPGEFRSRCAEFCGLSHANMTLFVVAEEPGRFDQWMNDQLAFEAPGADAATQGRELFASADCVSCHAPPGDSPTDDQNAPDLTTFASRQMIGAGVVPNTPENLADWLRDPEELKPGAEMPATELTDDQIDALIAYLGVGR